MRMRAHAIFSLCILSAGSLLFQSAKADLKVSGSGTVVRPSKAPSLEMTFDEPAPANSFEVCPSTPPLDKDKLTCVIPNEPIDRQPGSNKSFQDSFFGKVENTSLKAGGVEEPSKLADPASEKQADPKSETGKLSNVPKDNGSLAYIDQQLEICAQRWDYSGCKNPNLINETMGVYVPSHRISPFLLKSIWKNVNSSMNYFESMKFYDAAWEDQWYVSYFNNKHQPHISESSTKLNMPLLVMFMFLVKFVSSYYVPKPPKDEPVLVYSRLEKINPLGHFSKRLIGVFWRHFELILPTSIDNILAKAATTEIDSYMKTQDVCRYMFILIFKRALKALFMNKRSMIDRYALTRRTAHTNLRVQYENRNTHYKNEIGFEQLVEHGVAKYHHIARPARGALRHHIISRMTRLNAWYLLKYFVIPFTLTVGAIFIQHQLYQTGFSYSPANIHHFKAKEYFESVTPSGAYPFSFLSLKILNPAFRITWFKDYMTPQFKAIFMLLGIRIFCNWFKSTIDSFDVSRLLPGGVSNTQYWSSLLLSLGCIVLIITWGVSVAMKLFIYTPMECKPMSNYLKGLMCIVVLGSGFYYRAYGQFIDWTHLIASHYILFMGYFVFGYFRNTANEYTARITALIKRYESEGGWSEVIVPIIVVAAIVTSIFAAKDGVYTISVLQVLAWSIWYYAIGDVYETTQFMMGKWRNSVARAKYVPNSYGNAALSTITESTSYFAVHFGINMAKDNSDRFDYYNYRLRPITVPEDLANVTKVNSNDSSLEHGTINIPAQYLDASAKTVQDLFSFSGQRDEKSKQQVKDGLFNLTRVPSDLQIDARFANYLFQFIQEHDCLRVVFENHWVVPLIFFFMYLVHIYYENLKESTLDDITDKIPMSLSFKRERRLYPGYSPLKKKQEGKGKAEGPEKENADSSAPADSPKMKAWLDKIGNVLGSFAYLQPVTISVFGYLSQHVLLQAALYYTDKGLNVLATKYLTSMYGVRRYYSALISNLVVEKLNLLESTLENGMGIGAHIANSANMAILTRFIGNLVDALPFRFWPMLALLSVVVVVNAVIVENIKKWAAPSVRARRMFAGLKRYLTPKKLIYSSLLVTVFLAHRFDAGFRTIIYSIANIGKPAVIGIVALCFALYGGSFVFWTKLPNVAQSGQDKFPRALRQREKSLAFLAADYFLSYWYALRGLLLNVAPEKGICTANDVKALPRLRFYYVAIPTMLTIYYFNSPKINRVIFSIWDWFSQDIRFYVALTLIANRNAILPTHFGYSLFSREFPVPLVFDSLSLLILRVVDDMTLSYQI